MRPAGQKKIKKVSATLKISLWINFLHTLGSYRGLNQSEIVKGGPPLWLAVVQIILYVCVRAFENACAAAVRQREVSSRDTRSLANLATLSLDLATFQTLLTTFLSKKATSDKFCDFFDKL